MKTLTVKINKQDTADWLNDDNENGPEIYRAELEKRLVAAYLGTEVEVVLDDGFGNRYVVDGWTDADGSNPEVPFIEDVMNEMTNDWSWYPEA